MRRDHRPYVVKKAWIKFQKFYTRHFLGPQFDSLGSGFSFMSPWHVELFGGPIEIGKYATFIATSDKKVRLSVWPEKASCGSIKIGDYCLVCPGVRISSAVGIQIDDNCMLANGAYITDSDWHGIYDRITLGSALNVRLHKNVWIGDSAIVCKGVTIGQNSVIGAGAIVVEDIPANCIAAGNPARVVRQLDPNETFRTREHFYSNPTKLAKGFIQWEQAVLKENTLFSWLRHIIFPSQGD
ncbi:MAG: acyltransferase [Desulfobacteraceae bacterium]|nr:acyltransferase [Desulfobacteraceae bacterium]